MKKNIIIFIVCVVVIGFLFVVFKGTSTVVTTPSDDTSMATSSSVTIKSQTAKTNTAVAALEKKDAYVVYYTNKGFSPKQSQVPKGKLVKFINNSDKALMIVTDDTNIAQHNELNQSKSIGRGGVYTFNFTYVGVWSFHNLNNPGDSGNIVVY